MKYWLATFRGNKITGVSLETKFVCVYEGYKPECIAFVVTETYNDITTVHHIDRYYASKKIMDMGKDRLLNFIGFEKVNLGEEIQDFRRMATVENTTDPIFVKP
jgi:hypothetical protein